LFNPNATNGVRITPTADNNTSFNVTNAANALNCLTVASGQVFMNCGNIGIGTTTPTSKLSFGTAGDAISFYSGSQGSADTLSLSESSGRLVLQASKNGNGNSQIIASSTHITLQGNGGAGSSYDPRNGAAYGGLSFNSSGGSTNWLWISSKGSDAALTVPGANPLYLRTNDTTRLTVDATGNVGIGTTTPLALFVAQNVATTTKSLLVLASSSGSSLFEINALGAELHNGSAGSSGNILMSLFIIKYGF
jgi:hypothetical protein